MKKESFVKGALVATLCIVFSKILGIVYVIPFHAIIGEDGRSLYGYAYNIYMLFLQFSTVGVPLAISKMVSEYNSIEYHDAKKRTYSLALKIVSILAIISTLVLLLFAPTIANIIIGGVEGGNSVEDIAFVVRVSATAILIVSILSCMRGYIQGHKIITEPSISQVIEQLVRVVVIIVGSYIAMKLFGTKEAIGIAVFGATAGAIVAFVYLQMKMKKLKLKKQKVEPKEEEKLITNKTIVKKLIEYTIPFVVVSIAISLYNTIDMMSIIKPLVKYGKFDGKEAEMILNVITTWGAKLNVIVTSIAAGIVTAVLPNITSDYVNKNISAVEKKTNKTLEMILFFAIPMVVGLSFLAPCVWYLFYGYNALKINVFRFSIFTAIFYSLFLNIHTILQSVNRGKTANISIITGLLIKLTLNVPMIILFSKINVIPVYYASVFVTILAYIVPIIISVVDLKKNVGISFKSTKDVLLKILLSVLAMLTSLFILKIFVPLTGGKLYSIIIVALYSIVGALVYLFCTTKLKIFDKVFDKSFKNVLNKLLRRKK